MKYKYSILVAAAIVYLSLMKPPKISEDLLKIENLDKFIHAIMYATLTVSIFFENKNTNKPLKYFIIFIISTIFGGVIEILQSYFPPRTATWGDLLADAIGAALPLAIIFIIYYHDRKKHSKANRT